MLLIAGTLAACQAPVPDTPLTGYTPAPVEIVRPAPLGDLPQAHELLAHGENWLGFDREGAVQLLVWRETARSNTEVALAMANAAAALVEENRALAAACAVSEAQGNLYREQLRTERRQHVFDVWYWQALAAVGFAF